MSVYHRRVGSVQADTHMNDKRWVNATGSNDAGIDWPSVRALMDYGAIQRGRLRDVGEDTNDKCRYQDTIQTFQLRWNAHENVYVVDYLLY